MNRFSTLISGLALLSATGLSHANDFYRVDLMLVAYLGDSYALSEKWPLEVEEEVVEEEEDILPPTFELEPEIIEDEVIEEEPLVEEEVLLFPAEGLVFKSAAERMNYRPDMEVVWHQAWVEKIQDMDNAIQHEVDLLLEGETQIALSGTLSLYKSRYLHLQPNLLIQHKQLLEVVDETLDESTALNDSTDKKDSLATDATQEAPLETPLEPETQLGVLIVNQPFAEQFTWQTVRQAEITTSRRMRSNEMHYLDHPLLGILVTVSPVEMEEETEDTEATTEETVEGSAVEASPAPSTTSPPTTDS